MYCARQLIFSTLFAKPGTAQFVKLTSRYFSKCTTMFCHTKSLPYTVKAEESLTVLNYDGIVYVSGAKCGSEKHPDSLRTSLQRLAKIDAAAETKVSVLEVELPAARLVYSPVGPLNADYDDVRSYEDAAEKGIKRALEAGVKEPLLLLPQAEKSVQLVTLLGALKALYVPLQLREDVPSKSSKVKNIGVVGSCDLREVIKNAVAIESGRWTARDIGGGDPERMAAPRVEEYVRKLFEGNTQICIDTVSDESVLCQEYPLFAAVNRAASVIERHKGRIIYLTYDSGDTISQTLFLVGKGITYDTGGADIKAGGIMAGMSRDKCGAAAVAGFMQVAALLKPKSTKIVGALCLARNSVGENCYVADEVITSRSKVRLRVGNTDAEGRMVMADVLCKMREIAMNEVNPHLFTIATLTGHAVLTYGENYTVLVDNGPAREEQSAQKLQAVSESVGDMIEISTVRREDFEFIKDKAEVADVLQSNNEPSSRTPRGHQFPAAFLLRVSGLDKNGIGSDKPMKYTHVDIAGSSGSLPNEPTGCPVVGFSTYFLLPHVN
ncbi:putative aminopeptidase W07G4.4 isoform X1 [Schistocerca nitens]|uniref:putative aminopeptidase W07G4.4 isoform X1 n=1 Tax=Schistocerca nitens TaxID=7011 RepID=UPI0021189EFF|nr:putative aminopeptidase W07G4.4 isoform X1 [Schistocerca nitens]